MLINAVCSMHPISVISKSRYAFMYYIIIFLLVVLCHDENISFCVVVNISNSGEGIRLRISGQVRRKKVDKNTNKCILRSLTVYTPHIVVVW